MDFCSRASSFQPSPAPFQPTAPLKSRGGSNYPTRLTPTRPKWQTSTTPEKNGNSHKSLFATNESQNTAYRNSDGSYNNGSFSQTQYTSQLGFGSNSGSSMSDTRYGGDPFEKYDSHYMQMTSSNSPLTIQKQQHPSSSTRKTHQSRYSQHFLKQDRPHYQHQQQQLQQHNHTLREQTYGRTKQTYGLKEAKYNREQKQRSLSEALEEECQWKKQEQEQQRQHYQKHQVSHGGESCYSALSSQWAPTTVSRDTWSDNTSFLKQHDEKPPQALIAWNRYSASHRS